VKSQLAFVLGGGGARGALQVGALRALLEAGFYPDLLVGTSIGAVNAAFLATRGVNLETIAGLELAWQDAMSADLLPSNYLWLSVRVLFNRPTISHAHRMQDFFIRHGVAPDLKFGEIHGVQLVLVAADLNAACPVLYGLDPRQSVLEGVLASTTLPPWISPMQKEGQLLIDGGAVSNLPIETALTLGATEIIALDLFDPRGMASDVPGFGQFVSKLLITIAQRQMELELALASARRVPVRRISLRGKEPILLSDFRQTLALIERGYALANSEIIRWQIESQPLWRKWLNQFRKGGLLKQHTNY
jgi:NTE family protein